LGLRFDLFWGRRDEARYGGWEISSIQLFGFNLDGGSIGVMVSWFAVTFIMQNHARDEKDEKGKAEFECKCASSTPSALIRVCEVYVRAYHHHFRPHPLFTSEENKLLHLSLANATPKD